MPESANTAPSPSRVIKFRGWDKTTSQMYWPSSTAVFLEEFYDFKDGAIKQVKGKTAELMQFTGLHDKNGKEIYEGDIVDLGTNWWNASGPGGFSSKIQTVNWDEGTCGFSPFSIYDTDCDVKQESELCEVIGNIYQSPDLLKEDA